MTDDFTPLTQSGHWLDWLGNNPSQAVRSEIEALLQRQVPTATLTWVRLLDTPFYLTGGPKLLHASEKMLVTRAGLAAPFELEVSSEAGVHQLHGVFSWVATHLDGERQDQAYLDLNSDLESASTALRLRIYELDVDPGLASALAAILHSNENDQPSQPKQARARWWEFWRKKL